MINVFAHAANTIQVKGLPIEDVIYQAFFQHFDSIFIASGPEEAGFPVVFSENVTKIISNG